MKKLELKPYTIVMTIGPSNCGKSYFCENYLLPFLNSHEITNKYFSSDIIRKQLLHVDLHKHDPKMMQVSKQAFSLLDSGVDNYTQYPVNTCVVVVDATHLSAMGRKNIIEIAKKNNYSLVGLLFDYKNHEEYYAHISEGTNRRVIFDMVKTFKEITMKELERDSFASLVKIDSNDFSNIQLSFENHKNNFLHIPALKKVCYVGDIHGCFDEFLQCLLDDKGIAYEDNKGILTISDEAKYTKHILVGDYIDKGPKIKETIELICANLHHFYIVRGNHERWVYQYMKGELKKSVANDELIESWFNTIKLLEVDNELKEKFFYIYEHSYDFVKTDYSIVTHAPCENKYLGKSDNVSLKMQRNIRYPKKEDYPIEEEYLIAKEKTFNFLLTDADGIYPLHIFGHTMLKDVYVNKNKVCLDTGCVAGGYLSVGLWQTGQRKLFIKKYPSRQPKTEVLGSYFRTKDNEISFSSLEPDLQKRVRWAAEHKLNFISGTMSPCDKLGDDLESLKWGLDYYKSKGIKQVILQAKLMGSRCNLLLHKTDITKCAAFSRQGFLIKETRITSTKTMAQLFGELQTKYADLFEVSQSLEILFDGELLPWVAMGKDLIESDFTTIYKSVELENKLLEENGFENLWQVLVNRTNNLEITESTSQFKSSEKARVFEVNEEIQSIEQMKVDIAKYKYQVELFGAESELEFHAFSILKVFKKDGTEVNCITSVSSNIATYRLLNKTMPYAIVNFDQPASNICELHNFYDEPEEETIDFFWDLITKDRKMEGIVIKPEMAYVPGVAPYIKCRNKEYLRITYGPDYQSLEKKKNKLIRGKSIKRKIETSIKEWELGRKLLDIKKEDISINNKKWVGLIVQLMKEQEGESTLDPRL